MDIKWDGYIEEPYYSEKLTLDLRDFQNCLTATRDIDYVYNLAANMGGIGFITAVGADVMHDNVLINTTRGLKRTLGVGWGGGLLFFENGIKGGKKACRGLWSPFWA